LKLEEQAAGLAGTTDRGSAARISGRQRDGHGGRVFDKRDGSGQRDWARIVV
jgi:hypothetical protein